MPAAHDEAHRISSRRVALGNLYIEPHSGLYLQDTEGLCHSIARHAFAELFNT